jgi:ABC-type sugar transport system ATPase subunit
MNLTRAGVTPDGKALMIGDARLGVTPPSAAGNEVTMGIRPGDLGVRPAASDGVSASETSSAADVPTNTDFVEIGGEVESVEFIGARYLVTVRIGGEVALTAESADRIEAGVRVALGIRRSRLHFFDPASGSRLEQVKE